MTRHSTKIVVDASMEFTCFYGILIFQASV